jgi:hypothetical protein
MMTTIKYSPVGTALWTKNYNPGYGSGKALAVDGSGNVFVTGSVDNPAGGSDIATLKYSSAGTLEWTNHYNGPGISGDRPAALALTGNGEPIITGVGWNGSAYEYITIKYSNSGVTLWTNRCGPVPQTFYGSMGPFIKVDASGNVFFAGTSGTTYGTENWLTIKHSPAGLPLWTNRYAGPAVGSDLLTGLAVESNGNAFVTGSSWNGAKDDYVTIKYAAEVVQPALNIQRLGKNVVLSWTNAAFGLQSAPAITGTFTNVPVATSPYTNPISGGQRFFWLAQ